jgi:hypothetical protein
MIWRDIALGSILGVTLTISCYDPPTLYHQGNALGIVWPTSGELVLLWVARLGMLGALITWVLIKRRREVYFWVVALVVHLAARTLAYTAGKDLDGWPTNVSRFGESFVEAAPQGLLQLGLVGVSAWIAVNIARLIGKSSGS